MGRGEADIDGTELNSPMDGSDSTKASDTSHKSKDLFGKRDSLDINYEIEIDEPISKNSKKEEETEIHYSKVDTLDKGKGVLQVVETPDGEGSIFLCKRSSSLLYYTTLSINSIVS
jgi:hypothetical protein